MTAFRSLVSVRTDISVVFPSLFPHIAEPPQKSNVNATYPISAKKPHNVSHCLAMP